MGWRQSIELAGLDARKLICEVRAMLRGIGLDGLDIDLPSVNQLLGWFRDRDKPLEGLRIKLGKKG